MGFADDMSDLIGEMADSFGKTTAWVRSTPVTIDGAAGTVIQGTPVDVPTECIQISHNQYQMPGAVIEVGDAFYLIDGTVLPGVDDILKIGDNLHNIIQTWEIKPGDTLIGVRVQVRGGTPAPDLTEEQIALDEFGNSVTIVTTTVLDEDGASITVS